MNPRDYLQEDIETKIGILNYIDSLRKEVSDYKNKLAEVDKPSASLNKFRLCTIYRPTIQYVRSKKCNKCNKDGLVLVDNSFSVSYKLCSCREYKANYKMEEIIVTNMSIQNNVIFYDCTYNDSFLSIRETNIYDKFSEEHLELPCSDVFYITQEDCEEYCRRKNTHEKI